MNDPSTLLAYDTRDDRTEVANLLRRLPPVERVDWLAWCCARAHLKGYPKVQPRVQHKTLRLAQQARWDSGADEKLWIETVLDWWTVVREYQLDVPAALRELTRRVRAQR